MEKNLDVRISFVSSAAWLVLTFLFVQLTTVKQAIFFSHSLSNIDI